MRALGRWLVAGALVLLSRRPRQPVFERRRVVPGGPPSPRAEWLALVFLVLCALCAAAFPVIYAVDAIPDQTQYLGLSLGLSLAFAAAALITIGKALVVTEELAEDYPSPSHPSEQETIEQIVAESGDRFTRGRLIAVGAGAAGTALAAALATPVLSLGPVFDLDSFYRTPWRRGVRLVDEQDKPLLASAIQADSFYTAFPEGADHEQLGAPLIVVRLDPAKLHLPAGRAGWAPQGIVAYSKICTHAGCAIALYRKPTFPAAEPKPAFVCPCHYSTFDPASGGTVLFGPAGRPLPQLPLEVDGSGGLRAGGDFSAGVGPSWWGVRERRSTS